MISQEQQKRVLPIAADLIASFEGFKPNVYLDIAGNQTFGYGSLLSHYPDVNFPVTEYQAKMYLEQDLIRDMSLIVSNVHTDLTDNQLAAICSFVYNEGGGRFLASTMLKLINADAPKAAIADEFNKWVYSNHEVVQGLINRREKEKELFLT